MRTLIAEDDATGRMLLKKFFSDYGECDIAVDGIEALESYLTAYDEKKPHDLICLDIMMPRLDGLSVLKAIRSIEKERDVPDNRKVNVIMTTALNDKKTVLDSYELDCQAFAWKPIDLKKIKEVLKKLELID